MNLGLAIKSVGAFRWPLLLTIAAIILGSLRIPSHTQLAVQITNAMHAGFFGVLAVAFAVSLKRVANESLTADLKWFLYSALLAGGVATIVELLQILGPRDADLMDWLRDWIGIIGFLGLFGAARLAVNSERTWSRVAAAVAAVASGVLILMTIAPLFGWVNAYRLRASALPVLVDFESEWSTYFLRANNADFTSVSAAMNDSSGQRIGRLLIETGKYPGIEVSEPYPDWTSYKRLKFDISLESATPKELMVRIEDRAHNQQNNDRYFRQIVLQPGANTVNISLDEVRRAPVGREMDMSKIRRIVLYGHLPTEPYALYMANILLE